MLSSRRKRKNRNIRWNVRRHLYGRLQTCRRSSREARNLTRRRSKELLISWIRRRIILHLLVLVVGSVPSGHVKRCRRRRSLPDVLLEDEDAMTIIRMKRSWCRRRYRKQGLGAEHDAVTFTRKYRRSVRSYIRPVVAVWLLVVVVLLLLLFVEVVVD